MKDDLLINTHLVNVDDPVEARVRSIGVRVWAVIGAYLANQKSIERTADYYSISEPEVRAAVAYYKQHRALIDAKLLLNDAAFQR